MYYCNYNPRKKYADALKSWGEYSTRPVKMPDGKTVVPVNYFHPEEAIKSVFIPWSVVRGEI